jgi:ElaB/YqjD/DUF883 family membrane-anchored ribosome-binding protein
MEGWLYGLFTLFGVLAGGFFTYLGLRKQLDQQKELNKIEWRRKVRSEPLFTLRNELANIAAKQEKLIYVAQVAAIEDSEEIKSKLDTALTEFNDYLQSFQRVLNIQFDTDVVKVVDCTPMVGQIGLGESGGVPRWFPD